jgi:ATP-dependent RNA helicase DeaD
VVSERLTAIMEAELRGLDSVQTERMQRFVPLASSLGQTEDELAVIAMLLDDHYRKTLQAPPAAEVKERESSGAGERVKAVEYKGHDRPPRSGGSGGGPRRRR